VIQFLEFYYPLFDLVCLFPLNPTFFPEWQSKSLGKGLLHPCYNMPLSSHSSYYPYSCLLLNFYSITKVDQVLYGKGCAFSPITKNLWNLFLTSFIVVVDQFALIVAFARLTSNLWVILLTIARESATRWALLSSFSFLFFVSSFLRFLRLKFFVAKC